MVRPRACLAFPRKHIPANKITLFGERSAAGAEPHTLS